MHYPEMQLTSAPETIVLVEVCFLITAVRISEEREEGGVDALRRRLGGDGDAVGSLGVLNVVSILPWRCLFLISRSWKKSLSF